MMANDELPEANPVWRKLALGAGSLFAGLTTLFFLGVSVGFVSKAQERHGTLTLHDIFVAGAIISACAGMAWLSWSLARKLLGSDIPVARSPRKARHILILAGILGLLIGVGFPYLAGSGSDAFAIYRASPIPPMAAGLMLFCLALTLALTVQWHVTIDEHEQAAAQYSGMIACYTYFTVSVGWWFSWRGGFAPEPSGMAIFGLVTAVWCVVWLWRRSR